MPQEANQDNEGIDFSKFQVVKPGPEIPMQPTTKRRISKRMIIFAVILAVLIVVQVLILVLNRPATISAIKKTTTQINIHGVTKNVNIPTKKK